MARSARLLRATGAASPCLLASFSYFSKYMRIVAPAEPVPLNRKTTRAASPLPYSQLNTRPCWSVVDPSTGSVYLQSQKQQKKDEDEFGRSNFCNGVHSKNHAYENSSAPTNLIPDGSSGSFDKSPLTNLSRIKSIILFAASLSTANR